ncbi:MAG: M23 family metallopeptidase [Weeksellaceae bacterium]
MGLKKYKYNERTSSYEPVKHRPFKKILNISGFIILAIGFGVGSGFVFNNSNQPDESKYLAAELKEMKNQYELLNEKVKQSQEVLNQIEDRDNNLYRSYFDLTPISEDVRQAGFGGVNRYAKFNDWQYGDVASELAKNVDVLNKQMVIQSKSLDEIVVTAKEKDKMFAHLPAIQPVANKKLNRVSSGYGVRIHPILKIGKLHKGMDFSAPVGTPIYATADGKVEVAGVMGGYGNVVKINHGYGYQTLYGHMSKIKTRAGKSVKRGDIIGYVGNTGLSTGPHLHYEVLKNGKSVNPVNYFYQDISPEDYKTLIEKSSKMSVSLD